MELIKVKTYTCEGINIDRVAQIVKMPVEQVMAIGKKAAVL